MKKKIYIKVVLSDLRLYKKNTMFVIFEMNILGTSVRTWGFQWYIVLVVVVHSHDVTVKSKKTENWQKVLKLMILEIPYGDLL